MTRVRVGAWLLLASVLSCATGVEPSLELLSVGASGGAGGSGAAEGNAATAGEGAQAGAAMGAAGSSGGTEAGSSASAGQGGGAGVAGAFGTGGDAGGGGAAGMAGSAGMAGIAGSAGMAGTAGAGGMPGAAKPSQLTVSTTKSPTAKQAPSNGGTSYDDSCPQGQVLIGFNGTIGSDQTWLRSVSGVCGSLVLAAQDPYGITTSQAGALPVRPGAQATAQAALCPANQVVVGFQGRSGGYIDSLSFKCAPLSVGPGPSFTLTLGTASSSGEIGGPGGSPFAAIVCPAGQVAVSQRVNGAGAIDNFGLACSAVTLVVE